MPANPSPKRKVTSKKAASAESPSAEDDFHARTVHHVSGYMLEGSPQTQVAAYGALESLSATNASNVAITLVKAAVNSGNTSVGMSQEMVKIIVCAQKLRDQQQANKH
jgi:hypothetical protein